MKTKVLFLALCIFCGAITANAQLTTGEPTAKVIRTGNRAKAGNFGLYVGVTSDMFGNMIDSGVGIAALPLLNFKYMTSDNFELRVGLEAYQLNEKIKGNTTGDNAVAKSSKFNENSLMLYPGIAYHFSKLNILDVYVGAELPLGWDSYTKATVNDTYSNTRTKRAFVVGLGAFVGLQAYIADLPLAVGVEYGISSRLDAGLKYKNVTVNDNTTTTTYTSNYNDLPNVSSYNSESYSKLAARKGEIGGQVRVTLSYYFK